MARPSSSFVTFAPCVARRAVRANKLKVTETETGLPGRPKNNFRLAAGRILLASGQRRSQLEAVVQFCHRRFQRMLRFSNCSNLESDLAQVLGLLLLVRFR